MEGTNGNIRHDTLSAVRYITPLYSVSDYLHFFLHQSREDQLPGPSVMMTANITLKNTYL